MQLEILGSSGRNITLKKKASYILVMPASNACSERSFSTMKRIKTYLSSTMGQARLNRLNIYKSKLDELDLNTIANDFIYVSDHRQKLFGNF